MGHFFPMWSRKSEGISRTDAMAHIFSKASKILDGHAIPTTEEDRPLMGLPSNPNIDLNTAFMTDPLKSCFNVF